MSLNVKPLQINNLLVTFAALRFDQLDALKEQVDLLMTGIANPLNPDIRNALVPVALASLEEKHPDITEEQLRKNLDAYNFSAVLNAIFSRNSFISDEPSPEGEAPAAASLT